MRMSYLGVRGTYANVVADRRRRPVRAWSSSQFSDTLYPLVTFISSVTVSAAHDGHCKGMGNMRSVRLSGLISMHVVRFGTFCSSARFFIARQLPRFRVPLLSSAL